MKPTYARLRQHHYSSNELATGFVDADSLYKEIGYGYQDLIQQNPGYVNTCAVRMSLALIKAGVDCAGRLRIKDGAYRGRTIEPGAKLLADQLARPGAFGKPNVLAPRDAMARLSGKKGVILFWKISGYGGGHIDLIETTNAVPVCNSACYFSSKEIWFWPLT